MNDRTFEAKHAYKLEDPARLTWLPPSEVVTALHLRPGLIVADIGAGTGYFALPLAHEVGSAGNVIAVDLQQEMLELLRVKFHLEGSPKNIELVRGDAAATTLRGHSVDLVFLANVWHELDDHTAVLAEARRILRPSGRIAILDWRPDVVQPPGPPLEHRLAPDAVVAAVKREGWTLLTTANVGAYSYLVQAALAVRSQ
jgi:ubiquinone/menaquinone biosynthesis C-methylase UbiE